MDAFLNMGQFMQIIDDFDDEEDDIIFESEPVSTWIKEKEVYRGSTDVTLISKLYPDVYQLVVTRTDSFFKKIKSEEDKIFKFTNSETYPLLEEIKRFWDSSEEYTSKNYLHKRGVLLSGAPGTGKTSAISLICEEHKKLGGVAFKISGMQTLLSYIDFVKNEFRKIEPDTPLITIIEDLNKYNDIESEISNFLDGKDNINHHLIIVTSNDTTELSDIYFRPSRLDLHIVYGNPDDTTRLEYFKFKEVNPSELDNYVNLSKDMSFAELKELYICANILGYSLKDAAKKVTKPYEKTNHLDKKKKISGDKF